MELVNPIRPNFKVIKDDLLRTIEVFYENTFFI